MCDPNSFILKKPLLECFVSSATTWMRFSHYVNTMYICSENIQNITKEGRLSLLLRPQFSINTQVDNVLIT